MVKMDEMYLRFFGSGHGGHQFHAFDDEGVRYFGDVAQAQFVAIVKSTIDKGIVDFGYFFYDILAPNTPFVDIGNEQYLFVWAFNQVAYRFGILISVRHQEWGYFDVVAQGNSLSICQGVEQDVIEIDQLAPGTVCFEVSFHSRHGVYRYFGRVECLFT